MRKKKGFTLIELLSVIVILAIIALIAVPIILNVIENSRKRAAVASALGYVRAVNYKIADEALFNRVVDEDEDYVIGDNELAISAENIDNITGAYTLKDGRVQWAGLCVGKYSVEYNDGYAELTGDYCGIESNTFVKPDAIALSEACKTDADTVYSNNNTFKIEKVNDLACLSNLASTGKNFSGKTIYLFNDIDITDNNSYADGDPTITIYGDINGNGTVEGLKTELTTGAGFRPIGNDSTQFKGTFEGYAYTISNLMINRNSNYVGLFGYNAGTIKGLMLKDINVTGNQEVGGLAGYSTGTIKDIYLTGTVTGGQEVGGVVGFATSSGTTEDILVNVTVTGGNIVGGISGRGYSQTTKGAMLGGSVTASSGYSGVLIGMRANTTIGGSLNTIPKVSNWTYDSFDGERFERGTIETLDNYIDTYVGGDNDGDGYYFDYDVNGNITLYLEAEHKIDTNKLKGRGTEQNPYLIRNTADWRRASATVNGTPKYYKITNNIDFTGEKFYPLGTNTNKFTGELKSDLRYTVSNIETYGYDNTGIIGYNTGNIEGIVFRNVTMHGNDSVGIIGKNEGTIAGINVYNSNVTAARNAGGLIGYTTSTSNVRDVYVESTVTGTGYGSIGGAIGYDNGSTKSLVVNADVSGADFVGGAIGEYRGYYKEIYVTMVGCSVTASSRGGRVTGYYSGMSASGVKRVLRDVTLDTPSPQNGGDIEIAIDNDFLYNETCDTVLGGDTDGNGYYMDYDSNNKFIAHNIDIESIGNISGLGTQNNPYVIRNAADWRVAASKVDGTNAKHFVVTNDIDFTNAHFYPLSNFDIKFKGSLNGNMHTISNINMYGNSYVGIVGYNQGTVEGFNFDNITIGGAGVGSTSVGGYIGLIGYSSGTIKGINATNITVNGTGNARNVGGIVGWTDGHVQDITVQGTVTGEMQVGGAIGYGSTTAKYILADTVVSGADEIGGVAGRIYGGNSHLTNVVQIGGSATASSRAGRVAFYADDKTKHYASSTIPRGTNDSYTSQGVDISPSSINDLAAISEYINIETTATGDIDGSGYVFGYNSDNSKIIVLNCTN